MYTGPHITADGLHTGYDTGEPRLYAGEPTTNLMSLSGIEFTSMSAYANTVMTQIAETEAESGYACHMEITDAAVGTSARSRFGSAGDMPTTGSAYISIYAKQTSGTMDTIKPVAYCGSVWIVLQPLDGGSIYLTDRYRRFGVYTVIGTNSSGPNPGYSMSYSNTNKEAGTVVQWHSPQFELKEHVTPFVIGERGITDNLQDIAGLFDLSLNKMNYDDNADLWYDETTSIYIGSGGNYFPLPNFSVEVMMKSSGMGPGQTVGGMLGLTYGVRFQTTSGGSFRFGLDDGANFIYVTSTILVNDDKWHHLVATGTDGEKKIYIDGAFEKTAGGAWSGATRWPTGPAYWGLDLNNSSIYHFYGNMPVARIYDKVLSEQEIYNNYLAYKQRFGI